MQEKNADELFQNFVWHTRSVEAEGIKPGDLLESVPVEKIKSDGDEGSYSDYLSSSTLTLQTQQPSPTFVLFSLLF